MRRALLLVSCLVIATGCDRCTTEVINQVPDAVDQVDVFDQKQAAQVDVLWMIDNSGSMAAEQKKIATRFNQFFNQLIVSAVDYHIGIIDSDPGENGVLHAYTGTAVDGCTNCRFVTKDVPCPNPAVDVSALTDEAAIDAQLASECPAQLVFRNLVQTGSGGPAFEQGFQQAAAALGAKDVDPATGIPLGNAPAENAGFIRQDAALYIVFVSDEDEGAKQDGVPVRYYQRLFEGLKGAGNENKVAIAAITGYPDDAALPPIADVCGVLDTTFDASAANDDPRANQLVASLRDFNVGCTDPTATDDNSFAETGGRYIELACRTGGVVANMCSADYSAALDALGANAAGLLRKFTLSKAQTAIAFGADCNAFTDDDQLLDCDNNGDKGDAIDGPICVTAQGFADAAPALVAKDDVNGWQFEASTNSIRFSGGFIPKPGTQVEVRYAVRGQNDRACGNTGAN